MEQNELKHWGIKGMKWYQRRFQNKDGSLTAAGRKRYGNGKGEEKPKTKEEQKEEVLKTRSAKALYDNAHLFTTQELQTAYNRLQLEQNIARMTPSEVDKGEKFATSTKSRMDQASSLIESGSRLYNNVAKIYNSVYGGKKGAELPIIGNTEKPKSTLEKLKEKTEELKAQNEHKKAKREAELADMVDETERLKAENSNRGAKNAKANLDKKDAEAANSTPAATVTSDSGSTSSGQSFANSYRNAPVNNVIYASAPNIAGLLPPPKDDD